MGKELNLQAYCVRCRKKQPMVKARKVTMKNGKPAYRGKCPECNTTLFHVGVEAARGKVIRANYTNTMRVSIICPRCVRTVKQYMLTKDEHACISVPACPWCDEGKVDSG